MDGVKDQSVMKIGRAVAVVIIADVDSISSQPDWGYLKPKLECPPPNPPISPKRFNFLHPPDITTIFLLTTTLSVIILYLSFPSVRERQKAIRMGKRNCKIASEGLSKPEDNTLPAKKLQGPYVTEKVIEPQTSRPSPSVLATQSPITISADTADGRRDREGGSGNLEGLVQTLAEKREAGKQAVVNQLKLCPLADAMRGAVEFTRKATDTLIAKNKELSQHNKSLLEQRKSSCDEINSLKARVAELESHSKENQQRFEKELEDAADRVKKAKALAVKRYRRGMVDYCKSETFNIRRMSNYWKDISEILRPMIDDLFVAKKSQLDLPSEITFPTDWLSYETLHLYSSHLGREVEDPRREFPALPDSERQLWDIEETDQKELEEEDVSDT